MMRILERVWRGGLRTSRIKRENWQMGLARVGSSVQTGSCCMAGRMLDIVMYGVEIQYTRIKLGISCV